MKSLGYLLLFLFCIATLTRRSSAAKRTRQPPVKSQEDALPWFRKYGYDPCFESGAQCSLSLKSIIQDYQQRFHLRMTGTLDEATKTHMNRPRCGNKDKSVAQLSKPAALGTYKWSRSSLTYSVRGYSTQINQANTNRIIREAFDAWLTHIPLKIEEVCSTCKADFVLDFARDRHTDNYPFDGSGGTLAHAFFPEDGRVHFDKDEPWTEKFDGSDINLYLVAVHEIGHALGVDHTYNEKSIMYPSYQLMQKSNILPQPDRDTIQGLYGKKQSSSVTTTTTRKSVTTTTTRKSVTLPSGNSHPRCRRYLDVALEHPDGTMHTFDAGVVWRYLPDEKRWDSQSSTFQKMYPRLPKRLRAGTYDRQNNEVVFFTSLDVYRYDIDHRNHAKYQSERSLPRNLQNSIVGAIYYRRAVHVITATTIRSFRANQAYGQSEERDLSEEFPQFTGTVTTAFSYGDLHHFFTTDRRVYVWDERQSSWQTFGEPMETGWFACSGAGSYQPQRMQERKPDRKSPSRHSHRHRHHD